MAWIVGSDDADDGLVFGTALGYVCIWKRTSDESRVSGRLNERHCSLTFCRQFIEVFCRELVGLGIEGCEVTGVAFDKGSRQLAVAQRGGVIHRFLLDGGMIPRDERSVKIANHCPVTIAFGHGGVNGIELWSFGIYHGRVYVSSLLFGSRES